MKLEPVPLQLQIGHYLRSEQREQVRAAGVLEAGMQLFGDCCATEDVTAFEEADGEALGCEIGGCGEAVVAATDDDYVPLIAASGDGRGRAAGERGGYEGGGGAEDGWCAGGGWEGSCISGRRGWQAGWMQLRPREGGEEAVVVE